MVTFTPSLIIVVIVTGVTEFAYSVGWLQRFEQRHRISQHKLHGEAASADPWGCDYRSCNPVRPC